MFQAGRVIAIDRIPERLEMARTKGRAEVIDFSKDDVYTQLQEMTGGRCPDRVIEVVGCEAHAPSTWGVVVDQVSTAVMPSDQLYALAEAIKFCRKGGTVFVAGAYGRTMKTGQTHMQKYIKPLLKKIEAGEINPSFVITHRVKLQFAAQAYKTFRDKKDGSIKVVLTP